MALPPVVVEWQVGKGLAAVHEAFKSVEKAQREFERSVQRGTTREDQIRRRGATSSEALAEKKFRTLERGLAKETKAIERVELSKLKAVERSVREQQRMVDRANALMLRSVEKSAADEVRARERAAKRMMDIQLNSASRVGREASRQAQEEGALRRRFTGGVASTVSGSVRGAVGTMARIGGTALALGGGFSVADAVQTGITNRGKAADLAIQSGGGVTSDEILKKAATIGTTLGVASEQVIAGLDAFVAKSGDVKAGFASIQDLVELATATGGDISEISRTAGIVQMTTGNSKDTMSVMREMAGMGRAGSVDMRELAQYASRITAGAGQFGNKRTAITQLGAFVQQAAATGGATAAPEATEAVARLATDVFEHEAAFKSAGVKTRDKSGKFLRDPMSIVKETIAATGGDTGKLLDMFGKMSYRAVAGYQDVYSRTSQGVLAAGGSKGAAKAAGLAAIDEAFSKFADAALTETQVKEEAGRRTQEIDRQLEMVFNELRETVAADLLPELKRMLPQLRELVPAFTRLLRGAVDFADWFSKNPLTGIGAVIIASITKDLAAAGIGAVVRNAMLAIMAGGSPVSAAASAAGTGLGSAVGGAGALAAGGAVAGGAAFGVGSAIATVNWQERMHRSGQAGVFGAQFANENALAGIASGPMSADKLAQLRALRTKTEGDIAKARDARDSAGPSLLTGVVGSLTGQGGALAEAQQTEKAATETVVRTLVGDLERLTKAIQKAEGQLSDSGKPNPAADVQSKSIVNRSGTQ